jgi:hypothetical protein
MDEGFLQLNVRHEFMMRKYLYILLLFVIGSCNSQKETERFEIIGYSIGDTIDNGIVVTEVVNNWLSCGKIANSTSVEVSLFNNHIERIIIDSISSKKFEYYANRIAKFYDIEPYYSKDSLYCGLKLKAEQYYWHDSISDDCFSLIRSTQQDSDSLFSLEFTNSRISSAYRESIFGFDEECEIIIVEEES